MTAARAYRRLVRIGLTAALALGIVSVTSAQPVVPVGTQFQINTSTSGHQLNPMALPTGTGGFFVAWSSESSGGTDGDEWSTQGQFYAADGSPAGGEFQINTYTSGTQGNLSVAPDGSGGFVVVWSSEFSDGTDSSGFSVRGRRLASTGWPLGDDFQINSYTTGDQFGPRAASNGADGFVVVWTSDGSSGTDVDEHSIQARRFAADGSPLGDDFQVNTYTTDYQNFPEVVGLDEGFAVVWLGDGSAGTDTEPNTIQARLFASDGTPLGGDFQVNTYTTSNQLFPVVGDDGANGFVVVWSSDGSDGTDQESHSIQAQRYTASGTPQGEQFQVNTYTSNIQLKPWVGPDGAGGFVVVWDSVGSFGSDDEWESIQAQRYSADGAPLGEEFQVNTYTDDDQFSPRVGLDGTGGFVVTWTSYGSYGADDDLTSVQAQRYLVQEAIFADGFESGDLGAWSRVVP